MKKLELKHLAPYLAYGVKCLTNLHKGNSKNWGELLVYGLTSEHALFYPEHDEECAELFEDIKPILRPLSDLTKEIEVNGEKFIPINEINRITDAQFTKRVNNFFLVVDGLSAIRLSKGKYYDGIQKLFEWHFDVFGLIKAGLAIDINTLKK